MTKKINSSKNIDKLRHSMAHIMAGAVQNIYGKNIKFGIGPVIENGFYYDFDFGRKTLSDQDLPRIEKEMRRLINQKLNFEKEELAIAAGKKLFKNDPYKKELIQDVEKHGTTNLKSKNSKVKSTTKNSKLTIYKTGTFVDLCRGPHVRNSKELQGMGFKLTKVAGAYWRGDEKNKMLTRIYAVAFLNRNDLKTYLHQMVEAERRDHRKLGKQLEMFSFHNEGPGLPFWHPNGLTVLKELINFWREEHQKAGYVEISTPIILNESLWQTSGHMKNYKENMYFTEIDDQRFAIKPMNCPGGLLMYKERPHSYREFPMRIAELGLVHRHERAGVLHGLFRVRSFTQDDAHIYCTPDQIIGELKGVIKLTQKIYETFGFAYNLEISTRPKKYIGDIKIWNKAEATLKKVLKELNLPFKINPGDGAFYGPKIDYHIKDSIGRTWQCGTVQLDFAQPKNFKLEYIDDDGKPHTPVMLHRTIFGSLERFLGILIEHYAGAFPMWLAPVQIMIIPVGEKHIRHARTLKDAIRKETINRVSTRIAIDDRADTVGYKIRFAAKQKIPYTIVIGDREIPKSVTWQGGTKLTIRKFGVNDTVSLSLTNFLSLISKQIITKK